MRAIAVLLLALQLRPVLGAALCIQKISPATECSMPDGGQSAPPAQHCPAAEFCAAVAPAVPAVATVLELFASDFVPGTHFVSLLHSVEPSAPPAPPPNA